MLRPVVQLRERAVRAAYLGQQTSLLVACGVLQNVLRRTLLGDRRRVGGQPLRALRKRYLDLLAADLGNARAGIYPEQLLFGLPVAHYAKRLPLLAREVPRVLARMKSRDYADLPRDVDLSEYPPYYRRTFHWQSDGYLSRRSAALYDVGVEFLFGGTADIMRRQAIPPLRDTTPRSILDVACGTGRTLAQLRAAMPDAELVGLDLSPYYLEEARATVGDGVELVQGNAEAMPMADASFDAIVSVFLFHELPRNARRNVMREMFRVLRPGGRLVILDSVQVSDAEEIVYFLERFQRELHEPFYRDYIRDDLAAAVREVGFDVDIEGGAAYLTKVVAATRPSAVKRGA
jgi:ubiquinone/menaquinone biosynthesis C-methylase UbiE